MLRSHHPQHTGSRPITEVKLGWASPVLREEPEVLQCFCYFLVLACLRLDDWQVGILAP